MTTFILIARVAHLLGVILWIGGGVASAVAAASGGGRAARRAMLLVVTPGMLLAWAGGLSMLLPRFTELYASAGWMHGKLTVALIASGLTGLLTARARRLAGGGEVRAGTFTVLGLVLGLAAAVVVALALVKPGG